MPTSPLQHEAVDISDSADRRLGELAEQRLRETSFPALRSLRCECRSGELCVRGKAPTFYARQVAVETLRKVSGVVRLLDHIEVSDE